MCGIAGILHYDQRPIEREWLASMGAAMHHRGPDGEGTLVDGPCGLVHRRLSIIDLETGTQPIFNEDQSIAVILNGEIYNYRQLRGQLEARGHVFRTQSDTEVLVHLYEEDGAQRFLDRVNGMFSIALWDRNEQALIVARDRLGKKPLYYYADPRRFAFASEIDALRQCPGLILELDSRAVDCYFRYQYIPTPLSIYRQIRKLESATILTLHKGRLTSHRYWEPPLPQPDDGRSEQENTEQFEDLLRDAVEMRMISDVPLGAFLSGGLDSSAIVQLMADASSMPIQTFNIRFAEESFDESRFAQQVADAVGSNHQDYQLDPIDPTRIPSILRHFGEPFADMSALPTYCLCQMARQNVTVALSGDGADETLAGYNRYVASEVNSRLFNLPQRLVGRTLQSLIDGLPEGTQYYGRSWIKKLKLLAKFLGKVRSNPLNLAPRLLTPDRHQALLVDDFQPLPPQESGDPVRSVAAALASLDMTSRMLCLDMRTYLPDDIHVKVDRMSMAHSLEVRAPFMDYRLVEFLAQVPLRHKLRWTKTKILLRNMLATHLPAIAGRGKQGFELPIGEWFKQQLREPVADLCTSALSCQYFRQGAIQKLLDEHQRGRQDHTKSIWSVFAFLTWAESQPHAAHGHPRTSAISQTQATADEPSPTDSQGLGGSDSSLS